MKSRRKFPPHVYAQIIKKQDFVCACGCGDPLGADPRAFEWDHIRELWDGGEDTPDNLQALLIGHHKLKSGNSTKRRAKIKRIVERDGLRKPRMNAKDKALAKILEKEGT